MAQILNQSEFKFDIPSRDLASYGIGDGNILLFLE